MTSWSCISNSWFEIWWSRVQLFVFVQEALTGEKALLKGLLPLERFLSTNGSFCSSIYIKDSPKLPWGIMQRICGPPVFMTIIINHFAFWETLCPAPLVHYIFVFYSSLYFYTSDTFRPILALFTHFTYANFFICILPCGIFFLSLMMPFIGESSEFNFSSQRPHLNYILLCIVNSFKFQ